MGLNADITVHGWRQPTLEISLVAGGTLLADTKYYIVGCMGFPPSTYGSVGSQTTVTYDITTTATHRSIQISHKTYRDITNFADNGDSRTLITSARHCVADAVIGFNADTIKIATGSYAGTWAVSEWVDYDTFIINTPYVDNVPVQFYTDSIYYNRPKTNYGSIGAMGMAYYVHTTDPYITGIFTTAYNWTRSPWGTTHIENPTIVTAPVGSQFGSYCSIPELARYNTGIYAVLEQYGIPTIELSGQVTVQDIHDEVQSSGFIYNFGYYPTAGNAQKPGLSILAAIRSHDDSGFTITGASVTALADINQIYDRNLIKFYNCSINFLHSTFSMGLNFFAEKCTIFNNSTTNSFTGWIAGDGTIFYIIPRPGYSSVDVPHQHYTNLYTDLQEHYGIVQNKEYRDTGVATLWQNSYNQFKLVNVITYPFYWLFNFSVYPDIYMLENVTINHSGTALWHFRYYSYDPVGYTIEVDHLNVDTPDSNNVKQCITISKINITARFYRRVEFYVQDKDGVDIEEATIHIIDGDSNEYNTVTDIDGYAYLDCLEQKTVFVYADPVVPVHNPAYDTYYTDFVITVVKNGYQIYQETNEQLYQDTVKTIALQPSVEYVEGLINADVEEDILTGTVIQDEVTGVLVTEVIAVDVEEDVIYGETTEDIIIGITS